MLTLVVDGMKCENCKKTVEKGLKEIKGVKGVKVNLEKGIVKVDCEEILLESVLQKISELNFDVVSVG